MRSVSSSFQPGTFIAIEGLRGILAWAVVFSHLTYMSAFSLKGVSSFLRMVGLPSVQVFIIVSGFVITHTILAKREGYLPYIVRRFARIFPLFAVTCFVGFFTSELLASALSDPRFGDPEFAKVVNDVASSGRAYFPMHILAHLFMMHGAIPNDVVMHSEYAFNMPAWSISLEWQFYLVAPLFIFVLREKQQWVIPMALAVAASVMVAQKLGLRTAQPGALPFAVFYFAIGILSRLIYSEKFGSPQGLLFAVALAILFFPFQVLHPFLIWMVVFFGLANIAVTDGTYLEQLYARVLKSPLALYFGSRSYSIYLCHYPVISVVAWLLFRWSVPLSMLILTIISIPLIIVIAEFAYRWIEKPGIAAGKMLISPSRATPTGHAGRRRILDMSFPATIFIAVLTITSVLAAALLIGAK